jgi:hypothetical protein
MNKADPLGAARLFLMARGRGGPNAAEDMVALAELLTLFAKAGYDAAIEDLADSAGEDEPEDDGRQESVADRVVGAAIALGEKLTGDLEDNGPPTPPGPGEGGRDGQD